MGNSTIARKLRNPYKGHINTIITGNGCEFSTHKAIDRGLDTNVYFTDPYSSWQKGSVKNANGLIRQYLPKSSNIKKVTDMYLEDIKNKINTRPRRKLKFSIPQEEFLNYLR